MKINKILVIEDEKLNADRLKRMLQKIRPSFEILTVLDSISSSVQWLKENPAPDLIMMDIRLSDGLSFEILNEINVESPLIFTTAYDEYAVKAFKYYSLDYLLKPIEEEELQDAILKFESLLEILPQNQEKLHDLIQFMQPKEYRKRFLIPHRDGFKMLQTDEVFYFYSELGLTKAMLKSGTVEILSQTLEELEKQLDPAIFFRANRQFIIHIDSISNVFTHFNGKLKIELKNAPESEVLISREKAGLFKSWLDY